MLDFSPQSSSTGKLSLPQPTIPQKPPIDRKPNQWKRAVIASSCVALGIAAAAVGAATLSYRLTHLTVETGVINGRTLPLRVPINGKIKAFYAQPGAPIKAGQVLARIEPGAQETQNLLQIQSDVNTTETQLTNAVNSLALLQRQFQEVQGTDDSLKDAKVAIAQKSLQHEQAAIEAATAKASAARSDFDRYRQLHAAGAISQQKVDQTRSLWQAAEAEVRQAKANFSSAQVSLGAFENRVPIALGSTLMQPRMN
ncbi:TolC family protein, partial [Leptolyngbya sp. FACHB-36]|uniref:TolC family protein n=1 Tax=Leptolyngbya sp. FACHB-36 TaxID=2692808 RepID=UPI00168037D4